MNDADRHAANEALLFGVVIAAFLGLIAGSVASTYMGQHTVLECRRILGER